MPTYTIPENEPFLSAQDTILERHSSHTSSDSPPTYTSQPTPRTRSHSIARTVMHLLLCSLLVANLVFLALVFDSTTNAQKTTQIQRSGISTTNSASALFNLDMKILHTRYGSDVSYMSLDPTCDWLWALDANEHAALVTLDPPNADGSTRWGAITMFHQLHCLASIRKALQRAARGENIGVDYHDDAHWPHCLNYLRQGIICHADDTIELPFSWGTGIDKNGNDTIATKRVGAIDGSRDVRVCRDTGELFRTVAERGYKEKKKDGKGVHQEET